MRQDRYNRYERKLMQQEKIAQSLAGTGLYVYKNPSRTGTITLPKPTPSGRRTIGPGEEFQGDSYFMNMVRVGDLVKMRTIMSPEQEKAVTGAKEFAAIAAKAIETKIEEDNVIFESVENNNVKNRKETVNSKQKKLILDQPDRVTPFGKTEHIVREDGTRSLNDHNEKKLQDILLNEHPVGEIIIG